MNFFSADIVAICTKKNDSFVIFNNFLKKVKIKKKNT